MKPTDLQDTPLPIGPRPALAWIAIAVTAVVVGAMSGALTLIVSGKDQGTSLGREASSDSEGPSLLGFSSARAIELKAGPGQDYVTIGAMAEGAMLQFAGRNQDGEWIAVVLGAGGYTGWARVWDIQALRNLNDLTVISP